MRQRAYKPILGLVLLVTWLGATLGTAQEKNEYSVSFEGRLTLGGAPAKDAAQIVFWLTPLGDHRSPLAPTHHFQVTQQNKEFHPNFLVVPQGSTVDFPNLDPWFHNVFSQFRGKRFDLGLYQAGQQRSVVFDKAGVSFLFCNIHPEMTAVIVSVDSKYFAVSDQSGRARIPKIPAGRYQLHVWHRDALPDSLTSAERVIEIDQDRSVPQITLAAKAQDRTHKNKYGHDYDPTQLDPQY